jgi:hypothetical protein
MAAGRHADREMRCKPEGHSMIILLLISTLASLTASLVLGVRLLRLATRTRELPEAFMGSAFLLAGVVGYILMLIGAAGGKAMPPALAEKFFFSGYGLISLGVVLTYLFIWRVFRPASGVAKIFVIFAAIATLVTAHPIALPGMQEQGARIPGFWGVALFWLGHSLRIGVGLWGTIEAGGYYLALRRRLRLGLADPIVANRILLWTIASIGGAVIFLSTAIANATAVSDATGGAMEEVMGIGQILVISSVAFIVAGCQWFAFLPPRRYLAWLARRAEGVA